MLKIEDFIHSSRQLFFSHDISFDQNETMHVLIVIFYEETAAVTKDHQRWA